MKVLNFKKDFVPKNLPDDIYQRGQYITGSDTNLSRNLGYGGVYNQNDAYMQGFAYGT